MKSVTSCSALLVAGLSSLVTAKLGFGPTLPSYYPEGHLTTVDYWADSDYLDVEMQLVMMNSENDGTWSAYDIMLQTEYLDTGNNTFHGYVMREGYKDYDYAIWLTALDAGTPSSGGNTTGYAALSPPFKIHNKPKKSSPLPGKFAGVAVGSFAFGALFSAATFFFIGRRRASKRAAAMTPPEWRYSMDSMAAEKERMRVAMRDTA